MATADDAKVAVYFDFDNIVISRYDEVHGRGSFSSDRARNVRIASAAARGLDEAQQKLRVATVDLDAILDFASSFGPVSVSRAYADWSVPANANYQGQLIDRAVDLTQMFTVATGKNGADIRLSLDVIDDLVHSPMITHVVIVAGDSDYISLAQRVRRMGRTVIGIGAAGSVSRALVAACDDFRMYGDLPGVDDDADGVDAPEAVGAADSTVKVPAATDTVVGETPAVAQPKHASQPPITAPGADSGAGPAQQGAADAKAALSKKATKTLRKAMLLLHEQDEEAAWLHASRVKGQIKRLDPAFAEKQLGFSSFLDFVRSRNSIVETNKADHGLLRLRQRQRP